MKYLVFVGDRYDMGGGAHDLLCNAETEEEARDIAKKLVANGTHDWSHIYSVAAGQIIGDYDRPPTEQEKANAAKLKHVLDENRGKTIAFRRPNGY